jgi:transcriptional regulator with XRE-family HTH domain
MASRARDLRLLRLQKRLTQAEVAARMKVSQSYYSLIETGKKPDEIRPAERMVSHMRKRMDRTGGGRKKAGRAIDE